MEEYIDIFSDSPFLVIWSAEKETNLVNLGVGEREGMSGVKVVKTRNGVRVRPWSVLIENTISSCGEIKMNDAVR